MKIIYDTEVDVLRILLSDATIAFSDEDAPGVIIDYDEHRKIIGFEILAASTRVTKPATVEFSVVGLVG